VALISDRGEVVDFLSAACAEEELLRRTRNPPGRLFLGEREDRSRKRGTGRKEGQLGYR
jgi:hypothetical protein